MEKQIFWRTFVKPMVLNINFQLHGQLSGMVS